MIKKAQKYILNKITNMIKKVQKMDTVLNGIWYKWHKMA
jgi:hypothetical protein